MTSEPKELSFEELVEREAVIHEVESGAIAYLKFKAGVQWALDNSDKVSQIKEVLKYCKPHLDQMWAASIVGILLKCDFRDARDAIAEFERE